MRQLLLVRHAPSAVTRAGAFPGDEPVDDDGRADATALSGALPAGCEVRCSPALRCRQTARSAGLPAQDDIALAECDFGTWAGRSLAAVHEQDPRAARDWMLDPESAPHGGESLTRFAARVTSWLDAQVAQPGALAAITHAGVVKAAVVHALAAPLLSFWRIDVAPLSVTELHGRDGSWTVARLNCPIAAAP